MMTTAYSFHVDSPQVSLCSFLLLPSFLLYVPQPFAFVKTPTIYTPTATGVMNARNREGYGGHKEVRRTATNTELKGEGHLRVGLVAIIHHMKGHDAANQQVMTQFLAQSHCHLPQQSYMTICFRKCCVTESSFEMKI